MRQRSQLSFELSQNKEYMHMLDFMLLIIAIMIVNFTTESHTYSYSKLSIIITVIEIITASTKNWYA